MKETKKAVELVHVAAPVLEGLLESHHLENISIIRNFVNAI